MSLTFVTKLKQNQMKKLQKLLVLLLSLIMLSGMSQQQLTSKITSNGVQGSAQRGTTAFESCPPSSVFSQAPVLPDNINWSAYTSDDNSLFTYLVYENFSGITQPITAVHFWGLKLYYAGGWDICTGENSMVFNVKFYQDNAGSPGALVDSESINIYEDNTGLDYGLGYLYHYKAVPESPVNLSAGWISIQGTVSINPDDCVFLWMNSLTGDGSGIQSPTGPLNDNLSLCIEAGGGPVPETPIAPWALVIGIFLIAGSIMLRYRRLI
jgi:hypothetical protein